MSVGLILVIILVIFLLGGFSGRFGGYGYGYGHGGMGVIGIVLIVLLVLLLMGRLWLEPFCRLPRGFWGGLSSARRLASQLLGSSAGCSALLGPGIRAMSADSVDQRAAE